MLVGIWNKNEGKKNLPRINQITLKMSTQRYGAMNNIERINVPVWHGAMMVGVRKVTLTPPRRLLLLINFIR